MRRRKTEVYILTLVFLAVALMIGLRVSGDTGPLSFVVETSTGSERIHIWESSPGEGIVFLPSHAQLSRLKIRTNHALQLDGIQLENQMTCEDLRTEKVYQVDGAGDLKTITFVQSQNVPAMYLDTVSGSMTQINQEKGHEEKGTLRLYTAEGRLDYCGELDAIKSRGNSTFSAGKKPYSLKLSAKGNLLGMGAADKWVLLANALDGSHLRNKIVFDFAGETGLPYSPDSRFVDLYLNGDYAGLYLLSERNEIHPQRVAVPPENSFLVSLESAYRMDRDGTAYVPVEGDRALRIHHSGVHENSLRQIWRSADAALRAENGVDPETGKHWSEILDLDSWARKYLIEEIFGNVDGGRFSQFFYLDGRDPAGRIYAGPVWDYDLAMFSSSVYSEFGRIEYEDRFFRIFYVNANEMSWFHSLYNSPQFRRYMEEIYRTEFLPGLSALCSSRIEEYAEQIAESARLNQLRWHSGNAAEHAQKIKNSLTERTEFLNSLWIGNQEYVMVQASYNGRNVTYALMPGENLSFLPRYETCHWYLGDTNLPLDVDQPVFEPIHIRLTPDEEA